MKNVKSNYGNTLLKTQIDRKEHNARKHTMGARKKEAVVRILSQYRTRPNYAQIAYGIAVEMGKNATEYAEILRIARAIK